MSAGKRLKRRAALDQNSAPRGLRDAGDEGDRRSENERTGGCRNKNGKAANEVAGNQPCRGGEHNRHRKQDHRKSIRKPHEGAFAVWAAVTRRRMPA